MCNIYRFFYAVSVLLSLSILLWKRYELIEELDDVYLLQKAESVSKINADHSVSATGTTGVEV